MIKEYGKFHLSLRREARRRYVTVAAFPMPPEEENTRGVKLPFSTSRTRSLYARHFSPSCLRKVMGRLEDWLLSAKALNTLLSKKERWWRQPQKPAALISTLASSSSTADFSVTKKFTSQGLEVRFNLNIMTDL